MKNVVSSPYDWKQATDQQLRELPEGILSRAAVLRDRIYEATSIWGNKRLIARGAYYNLMVLFRRTSDDEMFTDLLHRLTEAINTHQHSPLSAILGEINGHHRRLDAVERGEASDGGGSGRGSKVRLRGGGRALGDGNRWWHGGV